MEKVGLYVGSFSPPHKGHFNVIKKALKENKLNNFIVFVASGTRDGITQDDSFKIWNIYIKYLPIHNIEIRKGNSVKDIYDYSKNNPTEQIYWFLGYRNGNQNDLIDIEKRTKSISDKYPNIEVIKITTGDDNISGTYSRSVSNDYDKFITTLPDELSDDDKKEIFNIVSPKHINEGIKPLLNNDYKNHIIGLTRFLMGKYNIEVCPKVKFIHDDITNSENFLGKTAYYNPQYKEIVLYTFGRDPISLVNSYSHEYIHFLQDLEGRLNNINTENTTESEYLEEIEREAYENGGMNFRLYKDSLRHSQNLFENMFIDEAKQVGVLYHYTSYSNFKQILETNKLKPSTDYHKGEKVYCVSMTRNKNFHHRKNTNGVYTEIRLELDGNKLSNKYKIGPYAWRETTSYKNEKHKEALDTYFDDFKKHDLDDEGRKHFQDRTGDWDEMEERIYFESPNGGIENIKDYIIGATDFMTGDPVDIEQYIKNFINEEQINFIKLEKELDDVLEPLGLDAAFTKHFKERCVERNLSEDDVVELVGKVVQKYSDDIADLNKGDNRVFTDVRKLVDLATVAGSYNDDYLKDLIFKTAYKRKSPNEPEFRTNSSSPKLKVTEDKYGLNMFMRELIHEIANENPKQMASK